MDRAWQDDRFCHSGIWKVVIGCTHYAVADIVNGSYQLEDVIHSMPIFKKDKKDEWS